MTIEAVAKQLAGRESFAIESTMSGRSLAKQIERARGRGFVVFGFYVFIASAEVSRLRVQQRVAQGGHDVPDDAVARRYQKSVRNWFSLYVHLFDEWSLYDNREGEMALGASGLRQAYDEAFLRSAMRSMR